MKKFTLFLVAMMMSLFSFAAQPKRIYAYGLSSTLVDKVYTFSFTANETPTSGKIIFYDATSSELVGEIALTNPVLGKNEVEIAEYSLPGNDGQPLNWAVELSAAAVTAFEAVYTGAKKYGRGHATIDNSPESNYFGRVYVTDRRKTDTNGGLYVYTPSLQLVSNDVYRLGRSRNGYSRPAVAADGTLFLADYTDADRSGIYVVDPSNLTTCTQFYDGTRASNGLFTNTNGEEIGSSTSGVGVFGAGANMVLYTMMEDGSEPSAAVSYHIGQPDGSILKSWSDLPTWICKEFSGINVSTNNAFAATEKGVWISQNDAVAVGSRAELVFIDKNGTLQFQQDKQMCNGAGLAVNADNSKLYISGSNNIVEYNITWNGNKPTLELSETYSISYAQVSTLSLDYAGNLIACAGASYGSTDSDVMLIVQYTLPTANNTCEVPAKKADVVTKVEAAVALYTVTTNVNDPAMGSVSGNLGTYEDGASAELTAVANEHYNFVNWTGDVTSTDNPLTITVNSDMNITANFAKKQYTLTVLTNDENKGTIDVATGSHEYGTEVTLTATPKPGYKLLAWSNKATTPSITLTMDNNKAVSAYFVKEYATDPTFTIEKVWENTINIPGTGNGYQAVGWDGKIYMQDAGNKKIMVFSNGTDAATEYATSGAGQQIAVDEAGNLIVLNHTFYDNPTNVLIYQKGNTTGKEISFTLPNTGRCDFFTASGDIYSAEGGYVYFYCNEKNVINRLKITNGAATAVDITTDIICAKLPGAGTQSNVVVDIFGNIHVESKNKTAGVYNITNLTVTTDTYLGAASKSIPTSTIGGCTFELGGKEWWAYLAGSTNYSSEWQLYNETDGSCLSNELYLTATRTTAGATANWLNAQVIDEKTVYIYQFCPKVGAALWKVSFKENYTVSATANPVAGGTVTGTGTYQEGATATLTATPNTGYKFVNWTKGGETVIDNPYTFTVSEDVELVANFEAITSKDPRAWAYDMKLGEDGDNYTFTFKATAAGQATITFQDKDGEPLAQPASQTMAAVAGENKFTIAKNAFAEGVDAFWSITMDGAPIEGVVEVTDQTRGIYDFYNMMGVVVDNNTDSKDFGKIYIQQSYQRSYATSEAKNDGITTRANEQTSGIFVYNQALDELNNPSNVGLKPTMPAGYTEIGSSSSAFQRLNIDPKTGNLVFSHAIEGRPAVFAINRDDMTGAVTNLLTGVADMTRSVAHCFDAEGMLYVMNFADNKGTVYKVINGEASPFTTTSNKFINANITIASDGRGGLWISQNRSQLDDYSPYYYQLVHVSNEGEFDWGVDYQTPHGLEGSSSRGALAYDVERQILAQGRNGKVELYSVSYEPTITLTLLHTIASNDLGNNIDGLAFDYAGDLYVVNSSEEKFQKFTLPTADNICTVAAPALEAIRFTPVYTVNVESNNNEWGIANGGGTFEEGQNATITAVAATNYKFVNWTKEGEEVSTENPYTFAVTESATYVANFEEITKYTINVTIMDDEKMGTVEGAGTYYEGTEVTLTAKANAGYVFVDWGDGNTDESRTFTAGVDMPETLTANFKVAVPRAWAYDLRKGEDGENYTFTFKTTSAGTATLIFKDKDGNIQNFGTHTATANAAEEKTITIAKSTFETATKDIYWSVALAGEAITKMAEITDPTKGIYDIVAPQGIAVDNNTDSKHFGQVYVAAATDGTVSRGAQTRGIFVYDPILNELNSPNAGYLPANATLTSNTRQAIHRVAVNPTNNQVAFAYNISGSSAIWSMNPENLAGDAVDLIEDAGITKANSLCFDESGALYVMDNANTSTGGNIYKIKDGEANVFAVAQTGYHWGVEENAMTPDGRGGLWIAQNRWQVDGYPVLSHVDKDGNVDFAVTSSSSEALKTLFPHDDNNASYRGQCAYYAAEDILAFGGNKEAVLFKVTYDTNNVPTNLEKLMSTGKLGTNIDGLAFDYAGDLYVASENTKRFYKFVVPTNTNTCTVPAPESQIIKKEARYTVTVVANPEEMGTVSGGGTEFLAGDIATLTATANDGYRFVNWTYGTTTSIDNPLELTVEGDITVTAHFEAKPLAIEGTVKRAVQIGESTVVLTHEANGTPHLYKVVDGTLVAEISQEGVVAADAGYLSISDIAATEDGKLVACNYVKCAFPTASGTTNFYKWNTLADNPTIWFTAQTTGNYSNANMGYTMAVKGTSSDAQVTITAFNVNAGTNDVRFTHHTIVDGKYQYSLGVDSKTNCATVGSTYELNASPLASANWIFDGENITPTEFVNNGVDRETVTINASLDETLLGKKFNGATYLTVLGRHLMVAPYADGENVAGVTVLDITNGLDQAEEMDYAELTGPLTANAAATAVKVNGDDLTITLVVDNQVYMFNIDLNMQYTRNVTNGNFGTICLPYASASTNGAEFYEVAGRETDKVLLDQVTKLEAGRPYIFRATAGKLVVIYEGEEALSPGNYHGLYGTFDYTTVTPDNYIVYQNELRRCGEGCYINANRAYLILDEVSAPQPVQAGRRRISMSLQGENQTTALDNITEEGTLPAEQATKIIHNGQLIIIRDGVMYNAQGQKL